MFKKILSLGGSNALVALLGLARNILVARLISVEDFGIASTFAITMSLIEMTSNFALDRMLVQVPGGVSRKFQSTLQLLQAMRGLFGAVILLVAAGPIASLFGISELAWAYQVLALVPLLRGLANFDMFRLQRRLRFGVLIRVELGAITLSTIAVLPLSLWLGDYRAMLYALLLQQGMYTLLSHHFASRQYRWAADMSVVRRAVAFGWPLLLNGFLMFAIFQGDKLLVGSMIGMRELGWFSAAFALTLAPTVVVAKTLGTFFLPLLSKAQHTKTEFDHLSVAATQAALLAGVLLFLIWFYSGPFLIPLLYGAKFSPAVPLLVFLGIMQGFRIGKAGPAIAATAKADTKNPLIANVCRILVLPIAWVAVHKGAGVMTIIFLATVGEMVAFAVSLGLLQHKQKLSLRPLLIPIGLCVTIYIVGVVDLGLSLAPSQELLSIQGGAIALLVSFLLWSMTDLRRWAKQNLAFSQLTKQPSAPLAPKRD